MFNIHGLTRCNSWTAYVFCIVFALLAFPTQGPDEGLATQKAQSGRLKNPLLTWASTWTNHWKVGCPHKLWVNQTLVATSCLNWYCLSTSWPNSRSMCIVVYSIYTVYKILVPKLVSRYHTCHWSPCTCSWRCRCCPWRRRWWFATFGTGDNEVVEAAGVPGSPGHHQTLSPAYESQHSLDEAHGEVGRSEKTLCGGRWLSPCPQESRNITAIPTECILFLRTKTSRALSGFSGCATNWRKCMPSWIRRVRLFRLKPMLAFWKASPKSPTPSTCLKPILHHFSSFDFWRYFRPIYIYIYYIYIL